MHGETQVEFVATVLTDHDEALHEFHLQQAQQPMKKYANIHRRNVTNDVEDGVYIKHQPHCQHCVIHRNKLSPHYFGPFQIVSHMGEVAYKL